jgi:hypothetical protein
LPYILATLLEIKGVDSSITVAEKPVMVSAMPVVRLVLGGVGTEE